MASKKRLCEDEDKTTFGGGGIARKIGRAPCCDKVGLKKGRWTQEEDQILINYIQANGEGSWRALPKNA
ncbi:hypothetical protein HN51_055137, partial [Arachis hypogaea]